MSEESLGQAREREARIERARRRVQGLQSALDRATEAGTRTSDLRRDLTTAQWRLRRLEGDF